MELTTYREGFIILSLCFAWYASSSGNSVVGKIILSEFPYPMTVSMMQFISITLYLLPVMKYMNVPALPRIPLRYWILMIVPLSFGKMFSSVASHVSIWKVPVSYAHTVKATMPLFTVILTRIILKEHQTKQVYVSLLPIVAGVICASLTELSFNFTGLVSALLSTFGFSIQNIYSKKCLKDTQMHHIRLLFILAALSVVLFFPLWLFHDGVTIWNDSSLLHSVHLPNVIGLLLLDGFCNFLQNMVAFTVINMLSPLSYAVANVTKRIAIISVSLFLLQNPVTAANVMGMMAAVFGVLMYNKAKYDQHQARKKQALLPSLHKHASNGLLTGNGLLAPSSHLMPSLPHVPSAVGDVRIRDHYAL